MKMNKMVNKEKYALISVSDKNGLLEIAEAIINAGYKIVSTGGTYKLLKQNKIEALEISEFTGEPEILEGRVKSLGRVVHSGLLADTELHAKEIEKLNLKLIDIVVCNFYPFENKMKEAISLIKNKERTEEELIPMLVENIDIGGPTMTWSAIKNYRNGKLILSDPNQYTEAIKQLEKSKDGNFDESFIKMLIAEASQKTALYRIAITNFLNSKFFLEKKYDEKELPQLFTPVFKKIDYDFRYGENPHQKKSAGYRKKDCVSIFDAEILNAGKVPSYNNFADMNAAIIMLLDFQDMNTRVDIIMKHGNPCGVGIGEEAFNLACETDQVSRFGGIYITNSKLTMAHVDAIGRKYLEVILAPGFEEGVVEALVEKDKRRRIFNISKIINEFKKEGLIINSVIGGVIVQDYNSKIYDELKPVSEIKPTQEQMKAAELAFRIVKHCNSNAVVLANEKQAIGLGVGQMSRLDSVKLAIMKAKDAGLKIKGSVLGSDAFFPKADGPMAAIDEGISGIIQPGGSQNDNQVIDLINAKEIFMIMTEIRHFKHSR